MLAVVTMTAAGGLQLLLNPQWRQIVRPEDHAYFYELWEDFVTRANTDPEMLFEQLASISVGPLIPSVLGTRLSDSPEVQQLAKNFIAISDCHATRTLWHHDGRDDA